MGGLLFGILLWLLVCFNPFSDYPFSNCPALTRQSGYEIIFEVLMKPESLMAVDEKQQRVKSSVSRAAAPVSPFHSGGRVVADMLNVVESGAVIEASEYEVMATKRCDGEYLFLSHVTQQRLLWLSGVHMVSREIPGGLLNPCSIRAPPSFPF